MISKEVLRKWNIGMSVIQAAVGGSLLYLYNDKGLLDTPTQLTGTGVVKAPTSSGEFSLDWVQNEGSQVLLCVGALMITLVYGLNFNYLNYGTCKKVAAAVAVATVAATTTPPFIRQGGVTTLPVSPLVSAFDKKW